ncbi:hypothetical protein BDA99DRAFT_526726 [Phascolomyces articulosus]|uniref:F-box domain-containing protein n=1 Tax=Phascolomyces articulosus TaxID=60185 RepID=A0AAD5JNZ4_9FUNG|nr:hypothetical protein BDA99DRAFT_526726 [Phascolomyces articulosus]
MTNTVTLFPPSPFDPKLAQPSLNKTRNTLTQLKYHEAVHHATKALDEIQQYQLIALLDMCAHSHTLKNKFDLAIENANDMIKYAPHWPIGYLRLGNILDIQVKYSSALGVYEEALEKVSREDPAYSRLMQLKNMAAVQSQRYVDLIILLPTELTVNIIKQLPEKDKWICFNVSRRWRQKIIDNSATIWKKIYSDDADTDSVLDAAIACMLPNVAEKVQDLTINTRSHNTWLRYLEYIENGRFKMIKSLRITEPVIDFVIKTNTLMTLSIALWNLKSTLTTLDFSFRVQRGFPLYLSDILFYCPNLIRLVVRTPPQFALPFGSMEVLGEQRHALADVELRGNIYSGSSLEPFLKYHPNIQRLIISRGLADDVLDEVDKHCHNLKLLGYGTKCVTSLEEWTRRNHHYNGPSSGVREILTRERFPGIQAENLLQLIRKNAKSLQRVHANLCMTPRQMNNREPFAYVRPIYQPWIFDQLEHLSYQSDIYKAAEPLFLQSIESCTTLRTLEVLNSSNFNAIVDILITKLPVLEALHVHDTKNVHSGDLALERLFELYAKVPPTSKRKCHTISFHRCDFITREVLDAIAAVETIKVVGFTGHTVFPSYEDLESFLKKMGKRLVQVTLYDNILVDDNILAMFCDMPLLETLNLRVLPGITDQGIKNMVDNAKPFLRNLAIEGCKGISINIASYVKRKITSVVIRDYYYP